MFNEVNVHLGKVRSVIRELFEYGKKRKAEVGEENVFDFSLGNPSVPAPPEVNEQLIKLIKESDSVFLHGYTSAQGDYSVRAAIATDLRARYNADVEADLIYMTCGAAASLCITLHALLNTGDEVITFAPFFPEYSVFVSGAGGKLVPVASDGKTFMPDMAAFRSALSKKTKAVIINSPNNPSGVVYGEDVIKELASILKEHECATGNRVFIISDEPYRELVFAGVKTPFITSYYSDCVVCYSYSKSLSLPGERIGYIAVNARMRDNAELYAAICGAGRSLGYVCAPNLFQQLVARVTGKTSDISVYERNCETLYTALIGYGYTAVKPGGAFYLFVKALEEDASRFAERAKEEELLLVPADSFGVKGYVRIAYCVSPDMLKRSLPAFLRLAEKYKK